MKNEYLIFALKESFDGERTDKFTKHVMCPKDEIEVIALEFVRYHSAERFNVWQKVKIAQ